MRKQFDKALTIIAACILGIFVFATRVHCQDLLPTYGQPLNDGSPLTLGMVFRPLQSGNITGIKYYRSWTTGSVTGQVWSATGTLLGQGTFTGTATGWQTLQLSAPVKVDAGTNYIVSYFSASGNYSSSSIVWPKTTGTYTAIRSVFRYGTTVAFPSQTYQNSIYGVEPIITQAAAKPDTVFIRDTIRTTIRDTIRVTDTVLAPMLCPDTTWVFADAYDTVGARFPDYKIYGQLEFSMPFNQKVRFVRRIEAVWRREELINGQWVEK